MRILRTFQLIGLGVGITFFLWLSILLFLSGEDTVIGGIIDLFPLTIFSVVFYGAYFKKLVC
jgi:hypothetical protein